MSWESNMPKIIKIIQCDCKKGTLEKIATTQVKIGPRLGYPSYQTLFYACDSCPAVFSRLREIKRVDSGWSTDKDESSYTRFEQYKGLTKEELIQHAEKYQGDISNSSAAMIRRNRKQ